MAQVKDLTETTLKDRWQEVKNQKLFWDDVKVQTLKRVRKLHVPSGDRDGRFQPQVLERYRRREA